MPLYKVIAEEKRTNKVIVVVNAESNEEALEKVSKNDIIAVETALDMKVDGYIPLEAFEY